MNIRIQRENHEKKNLCKFASLSSNSKGRKIQEEKCNIRTEFQRDRDRILHSKAFRRLKHKTQVFVSPEGDHFRTRLTHTLEVSQIGRTLARALNLNEDLVEAIALGHDLGHTPFGHTGEKVLNSLNPKGFNHNNQSIRIVNFLEQDKNRIGLNLTYEVLEGIMNHSGGSTSETLEGQIVYYSDRIAYINHDIDDAIRAEVISQRDLPIEAIDVLGNTHGTRINTMIVDIIENSIHRDKIKMSKEIEDSTNILRDFMFKKVYLNPAAKSEEEKSEFILKQLYKYYMNNYDKLPRQYSKDYIGIERTKEDKICDYIAGMTDRYAINAFNDIFVPKPWGKF